MDSFSVNMDLAEVSQLIVTLAKENKRLASAVKEVDSSNAQEKELLRESLKANTQIAYQIQSELDKSLVSFKGNDKFKKAEHEFQLGCRTLEGLAEKILQKEQEHCKSEGISFEQLPLLKDCDDELEEEKKQTTIQIEGISYNKTVLLQEANDSLKRINRICKVLNGIVLSTQFQRTLNRNPMKGINNKMQRQGRNSRLSYLKYI